MISTEAGKTALIAIACLCLLAVYNIAFEDKLMVEVKDQQQRSLQAVVGNKQPEQEQQQVRVHLVTNNDTETNDAVASPQHHQVTSGTSSLDHTEALVKKIDTSHPVFVLALPNHMELALPRYFECGNITIESNKLGRKFNRLPYRDANGRWATKPLRKEIAQFMLRNIKTGNKRNIFEGCCNEFEVFMDIQASWGLGKKLYPKEECFDPVLYPGALEGLHESYPQGATILNVVRDPVDWFQSLSPHYPQMWNDWCNPTHNNAFPSADEVGNQRAMVGFYMEYQHKLRSFAKAHPNWKYIEIDMDMDKKQQEDTNTAAATAVQLEQQLGIDAQCWKDSTRGNTHHLTPTDPKIPSVLKEQERPNNIGWPVLVTALPKSGTSTAHGYFQCGGVVSAHQWTTRLQFPYNQTTIGECMTENTNSDTYPIFKGCGNALVWSDIGVLRSNKGGCYYPQLHQEGLERFYKSYPYGTLLNVVRSTKSWVDSAFRWRELPNRWIKAQCEAMPPKGVASSREDWEQWYDVVQDVIRQFARTHPTMTYIEIPLNHQAGDILHDIFRYPKQCWGHANVNKKNPANVTSSSAAANIMATTTK